MCERGPSSRLGPVSDADAPRLGLVVYRRYGEVDAIDEYSRRLSIALCDRGVPTQYVAEGLRSARRQVPHPGWILLQYNPFSYGRWGVAPGLVAEALKLRRAAGVRVAVSVHEAWVLLDDPARSRWRSALMGAYQRAQLRSLLRLADVVFAATQSLVRRLGHDAVHVPVGSNITPLSVTREAARRSLGIGDELVICLFGTAHPSRALHYAKAAIMALTEVRGTTNVRVLNLGLGAPDLDLPTLTTVDTPGHLVDDELSLRLWAGDLLLLPFADGISTRRTTLMAGLAHGLPVVGLHGPETDAILMGAHEALTLTPVGDVPAFRRATMQLAGDWGRLRAQGDAGRRLYAQQFDWPVAAARVCVALDGLAGCPTTRRS